LRHPTPFHVPLLYCNTPRWWPKALVHRPDPSSTCSSVFTDYDTHLLDVKFFSSHLNAFVTILNPNACSRRPAVPFHHIHMSSVIIVRGIVSTQYIQKWVDTVKEDLPRPPLGSNEKKFIPNSVCRCQVSRKPFRSMKRALLRRTWLAGRSWLQQQWLSLMTLRLRTVVIFSIGSCCPFVLLR
jgi:hypothetical protein